MEYRRELKCLATDLGLDEDIIWTGEVPNSDLPAVLAACDIVVNPCALESFGRVIVEAMLMAKPVIATRAGGTVEVIEDGVSGYLVAPDDPAELSKCLEMLLECENERQVVGMRARSRARALFDVEGVSQTIQRLYSTLLAD